jgi:hypothetical protein
MPPLRILPVAFFAALVLPLAALAADYHVAIAHPAAADTNPGTADRPWRTIQHAANQARPGDTIHVQPGVYLESVTLAGPQDAAPDPAAAPIRFLASGDRPAVLEGATRLTAADIQKTDTPRVFAWTPPRPLARLGVNKPAQPMAWVFWNGKRLPIKTGKEPLATADGFHFTRADREMRLNLAADTWPADAEVLVAHRPHGFSLRNVSNITIRGFEFRHHAANAIEIDGSVGVVLEDNHIVRPNMHGIYVNQSRALVVRRNRVFEPHAWASNFKGQGHLIEENMFQTTGTRGEPAAEAWVGVLKFNGGSYITARHNFLADRPPSETRFPDGTVRKDVHVFGGIWGDIHCYDNRIYGNSVTRQGHTGIYLEFLTNRSTVMWNALQDNPVGISTRQSSGNVIRENWIFDTVSQWGRDSVDFDNMPTFRNRPLDHPEWARERLDGINLYQTANARASQHNIVVNNLVQTSGRPVSIPVPGEMTPEVRRDVAAYMVIDPSEVPDNLVADIDYTTVARSFNSPLDNLIDRNLYNWSPARAFAGFAWFPDRQIDTFEEWQRASGMDAHSRVGDFKPADIGLQIGWTLQPDSRHPDLPLAFDHDGGAERSVPVGVARWARGIWIDSEPEPYGWFRAAAASTEPGPGQTRGRFGSDRVWTGDARQWTRLPLARSGFRALTIANPSADPARIPVGGLGWRTQSIPVTPGIELDLGVHLRGTDLKPADPARGAEVVAVFTDWTGHQRQTVHLVGEGARRELVSGTYDWTEVRQRVTVPPGATRFLLYVGLHPATGQLLFDDVVLSMVLP